MVALSGGDKLRAKLAEISRSVAQGGSVNVGFLENATYPDGTPVAMVAAIQEFGAPRRSIPPRPFFRNMIAGHSDEWGDTLASALKTFNYDVAKALDFMGQDIQGELRQSIIDTNQPPLSEITLMLRQMKADNPNLIVTGATVGEAARRVAAGEHASGVSQKPLVDTGVLLRSVDYEVVK
jgi:hypothetical protein